MDKHDQCAECGAAWSSVNECTENFHRMLSWEWEHQLPEVHHLMVLCYHLQHPSLYSPQALKDARRMLVQFLEEGITPQDMRSHISRAVDSGTRSYKIKGTPESHGAYEKPIQWEMLVTDVIRAGVENYYASVHQWADSTLRSLRASGNMD